VDKKMKCETFKKELTVWMEASWEETQPRLPTGLAQHARECPACATRAHAAMALVTPAMAQIRTPADLGARVMDRILAESRDVGTRSIPFERGERAVQPRRRLILLTAAAALLVLTTSLVTFAATRTRMGNHVEVHLVLEAPSAQSVSVVGDWNAWEPGTEHLADPDGDGRWEITIQVERGGEYRYQFVVDDSNWMSDPEAPLQVTDGFGGTNSVLDI
jgi:AMP-activated protein kinase-like protein